MKKPVSIGLASLMTAQLIGPMAKAQFEDFPPPPPPPLPDSGGANSGDAFPPPPSLPSASGGLGGSLGGGTRGGSPTSSSGGSSGILTKKEKDKFAKAGIEDINSVNFPETLESFDFPNVEITDVINAISELTGKNFIIDPGVRGKITIVAPSKITVAEAYKAFLSALAINGFTVVPSGAFLKVKSARNAQRDNIDTFSGAYYPNSDQMITRIIHLKHISAAQVNRDLRILPSKDGEMNIYEPTNSIIISDYGSNIDRVMKIIGQLDVPGFEEQLEVIPIHYAKSKDLADLVDKIVNKGAKSQGTAPGTFTAGVPRFTRSTGASSQQGASFFMAIPEERTNSIIAVGNKSGITRIKKLISQLDFKIPAEGAGGVYVYYVKNGDAEKIAQTLTGVTKDATPKPQMGGSLLSPLGPSGVMQAPTEIFGNDVKITADKSTNSLVIVASKQDYETVLNILQKIDSPRDQVYVEAIIMEMNVSDGNSWGIGYFKYGDTGYGKAGFNGFTGNPSLDTFLSPAGGTGGVLGFGMGKTVSVLDPATGKSLQIPSLLGFINFLKTTKKVNILSTPQIMALDNQEAEIEVGDKVVVGSEQTTTGTSGTTIQTPKFDDATIKLNIKPFISPASETVRMEIKQNVSQLSSVQSPKAFQDSTQPIAKRSIKTMINVNNGDTAILGGLIKEDETDSVIKVPLLGDIPIIGWLFKSTTKSKNKTNMLVFLTPKIVRSMTDSHAIISKRLDQRIDYIKSEGGKDPFGAKMDEVYRNIQGKSSESTSPVNQEENMLQKKE